MAIISKERAAIFFEQPSVCVHASPITPRIDARVEETGALIAEGKRNPRAPCARREKNDFTRGASSRGRRRRPALGLAAVDAVPVLRGHGPDAVALDVACLLARACAGRESDRSLSLCEPPRHRADATTAEQRRVDGGFAGDRERRVAAQSPSAFSCFPQSGCVPGASKFRSFA